MKNILLLTNFSETSRKAITSYLKACNKKQKQEYKFTLLNTYKRIKTGQSQMVKFEDVLGDFSKQDLEKEVQMIYKQPEFKDIQINTHSEFGDLVDVVERISDEKGIDLIVMGTKGSNLLKELLLASDTDRLIRLSKEPVLVIPESINFQKPKKIVFATNLEKCKNINEFRKLTEIIKDFEAELLILNIYPDKKPDASEFEKRLLPELSGIKHTFFYVRNPDIADGITGFVKLNKAHLLAIIDHKVNILSELFRHSVQYKLTHSAEMPLLIIHE